MAIFGSDGFNHKLRNTQFCALRHTWPGPLQGIHWSKGLVKYLQNKLTSRLAPGSLKKISGIIDLLRSLPANSIPSIIKFNQLSHQVLSQQFSIFNWRPLCDWIQFSAILIIFQVTGFWTETPSQFDKRFLCHAILIAKTFQNSCLYRNNVGTIKLCEQLSWYF